MAPQLQRLGRSSCSASGGIVAELIGDRVLRVAPLTDTDADADDPIAAVVGPSCSGPRLGRGRYRRALRPLLRLSVLGQQISELVELDLNPVIAGPGGVWAVDWRMRLAPAVAAPGHDLRRLR